MIIGLTGKYCSGKNHIAALLEARGLDVLDVDKLGYQVLETEKEAVFSQFGSDLKNPDGSLNRKLLGKRVFGKAEELAALEKIVHPPVNLLTNQWITEKKESGKNTLVINAALLHKSAVFSNLDRIIIVKAPFLTRFLRAKQRDKLSFAGILKRFSSQKDFNSQYLTVNAEIYKVENPGFFSSKKRQKKLESRMDKLIDKLLEGISNG